MLSFEIVCAQEEQLDKENFGIAKLITSPYPDGSPAIIAHLFQSSPVELEMEGGEVLGMAPGGAGDT